MACSNSQPLRVRGASAQINGAILRLEKVELEQCIADATRNGGLELSWKRSAQRGFNAENLERRMCKVTIQFPYPFQSAVNPRPWPDVVLFSRVQSEASTMKLKVCVHAKTVSFLWKLHLVHARTEVFV